MLQTDGKTLVLARRIGTLVAAADRDVVLRFTSAGVLDTTFGKGGVAESPIQNESVEIAADGRIWLAGEDRYIGLLRRYLIVHGLRLRFGSFWGDVIICIFLTIAFFILWHAHHLLYDLRDKVHENDRIAKVTQSSNVQRHSK